MLITTSEMLAEQSGGRLIAGDESIAASSIAIDSREVTQGAAFVAFTGANADGHAHIAAAIAAGARVVVVTRPLEKLTQAIRDAIAERNVAVILVDNALEAVRNMGAAYRNRFRCPVIGVTGSTGKTTTKDFLTAALSVKYNTTATQKNHNNELGVPLTLLSGGEDTQAFVVEMGMRAPGEIADLCKIARPTMGLITNVGTSHIEFLGSLEAIAATKAELLQSLPANGRAFINGDDAQAEYLKTMTDAPITTYGVGVKNDICAEKITLDAQSHPTFTVICEEEDPVEVTLSVPGRHNVYNALAAFAVGYHCGIAPADIATALQAATITPMRMEVLSTAGDVTVINDAYNANPTSMRAAIDTLTAHAALGKKIAALGGMGELGSFSNLAHFELGKYVVDKKVDELVVVGSLARRIGDGAIAGGLSADHVHYCESVDEAAALMDGLVQTGDVVLVKASRAGGLEALVERIVTPLA